MGRRPGETRGHPAHHVAELDYASALRILYESPYKPYGINLKNLTFFLKHLQAHDIG
jgi:hypothetical protein